jgi:O-antigen/teichoic acid export membrane protein
MESARILRDATKLFGAQVAGGAISLVFSAWLVRALSEKELALYPVLGLCVGFTLAASGLGLSMSQQRLIPESLAAGREAQARGIARSCFWVNVWTALALAALAAVIAPQLSRWLLKTPDFTGVMRALAPSIFLGAFAGQLGFLLQATNQFGQLSINRLVSGSLGIILAVPCYHALGLAGLVIAMTLAPLAAAVLSLIALRSFLFGGEAEAVSTAELVRSAVPFFGTSVITFLNTNADSLLLATLTTPEKLATYYVAYKFVGYLFHFANSGFRVLLTKLGQLKAAGSGRVAASFTKASRYVFLFLVPVSGLLAVLSPITIRLYAGPRYQSAIPILALLCLYMLVFMLYGLHRFYIFNLAPPAETFKLQLVTTCLTLAATAVAVHYWGGLGAAGGQTVALVLAGALGWFMLGKVVRVRYDLSGLRVALIALAAAAPPMLAGQLLGHSTASALAGIAVGSVIFLAIFVRLISQRDAEILRHYLPWNTWRIVLALALVWRERGPEPEPAPAPALNPTTPYAEGES